MNGLLGTRVTAPPAFLTDAFVRCYSPAMNLDQIKLRLHGGFRPFALHLSDGRKFSIPHPEFILLGKGVVAVLRKDGLIETVDALQIVSIEDLSAPTAKA